MPTTAEQIKRTAADLPKVFPDPDGVDLRRIADLALEGKVLFYGRRPVEVGRRNIDWAGGHIAHQEWRAQLNRFFQLQALRRTYRETKDEQYARCARDYIEDWIDAHAPYDTNNEVCPMRDNSLNMSIRMGGLRFPGWLGVLVDFLGSEAFDEQFIDKMLSAMAWQLDWLGVNLKPIANWRIASLDALFSNALRLPERFGKHLAFAVEGLNTEFETQILPDGVHLERSGEYHNWMCGVFIELWRIARTRGDLGLSLDDSRIARMHSYTLHHVKPNGAMCGFNDCGGAYRTSDSSAADVAEQLKKHIDLLTEIGQPIEIPKLAVFDTAGHVFYRTGWGTDDLWWAFDAVGWCRGGHSHLSRLSIELHNGRRTTLPDPGVFDYEMSNPLAPAGKATAAHSTMNVNLGNQANVEGKLVRAVDLPTAVVVSGTYEGSYWQGDFKWNFDDGLGRGWFGRHDRTVVWLKDRAMVVLDCLYHDASDPAYLHWISDDVPVELAADGLGITTGDEEGNVRLRVCPVSDCTPAGSIRRGEKDPYLGWVRSGHEVAPGPLFQVRFDSRSDQRVPKATECATVIAPFTGPNAPEFSVAAEAVSRLNRQVTINWPDGAVDRIIYTQQLAHPVRNCGQVHTDAPLVLICRPAGGKPEIDRVGGSFLRIDQQQ